ncbi:TonB family protein [Aliiglaciecola litoralis]|uniref:Protein TonB n=1 Tax=Aliiglaciecola litoralis TaxID=582857 RepID=A0ABP3WXN8_9ALTE
MQNRILSIEKNRSIKMIGAISLAAIITFLLFVMMQKLIAQDDGYTVQETVPVFIDPVLIEKEQNTIVKTEIKPILPPPAKPQTIQPKIPVEPNGENPDFEVVVNIASPIIDTFGDGMELKDMESRPIVRVPPKYPNVAAQQGVEGWVELQFTIDASGAVKDVRVINSEPKRMFDREATKALKKWKYKPQLVNGKPVDKPGQQVVLDFKLES